MIPNEILRSSNWEARLWVAFWILATLLPSAAAEFTIVPRWAGKSLEFDNLIYTNSQGQRASVTRLDMLLSRLALRRVDGTWLERTNWFAYVSARSGRTTVRVDELPSDDFDRMRFTIGVPPIENHANPSGLAANHPLNPNVNDMHWSWQSGYVFLALEGNWSAASPDARRGGYSWHLATDRMLTVIDLPLNGTALASTSNFLVPLNIERLFRMPLSDENSSTHSRPNDLFAERLRSSIEQAFETPIETSVQDLPKRSSESASGKFSKSGDALIASNATPFRFTFSRYFPQPSLPLDNPLTEQGVELGKRLFNDPRLSINNRQSCASCHTAQTAFTDGRKTSPGAENQTGTRNAMPLFNLAWKKAFFWDGRAETLREQVLMPIQNPIEMHETLSNVVTKLQHPAKQSQDFSPLFTRAFGTSEINSDRVARALEQFLLAQVAHSSKFDRVLNGEAELNEQEQRGFELFHTEYDPRHGQYGADCFHCHGGPLFQSQAFANNGLDAEATDPGRFLATGKIGDRGKFAVPSLRNVEVTGPYMHDGRFTTLEEAVEHYASGVKRSDTLDPNLAKHPDGGVPLSTDDRRALVAFLRTLTDQQFSSNRVTLARSP